MTAFEVELQEGLKPAVITTSGPDRPGVSGSFFTTLSRHNVQLLDVEQTDFRGSMMLAAFVGMDPNDLVDIERELRVALLDYGQRVTIETDVSERSERRPRSTHVVVVLGNPVTAEAVSKLGMELASVGANIDTIRGIAQAWSCALRSRITRRATGRRSVRSLRRSPLSRASTWRWSMRACTAG